MRTRFLILLPLILLAMLLLAPVNASAVPHYYLQMESFEEFKPITKTTDATYSSNAVLNFAYPKNTNIHCHFEGKEKLYTNGTAGITELQASTCGTNNVLCLVKATVFNFTEEAQWPSELSGNGTTGYFNTFHYGNGNQGILFEVTNCEQSGWYSFGTSSWLKAEAYNGVNLEYVFPESPLAGTLLQGLQFLGLKGPEKVYGRLRVSPLIGREVHVGA